MALLAVFGGVGAHYGYSAGLVPGITPVGFGMMLRWIDGWLGRRRCVPGTKMALDRWMTRSNG